MPPKPSQASSIAPRTLPSMPLADHTSATAPMIPIAGRFALATSSSSLIWSRALASSGSAFIRPSVMALRTSALRMRDPTTTVISRTSGNTLNKTWKAIAAAAVVQRCRWKRPIESAATISTASSGQGRRASVLLMPPPPPRAVASGR